MAAPARAREPLAREVERSDRRWLLTTAIVFAGFVVLLLAAYGVYRATGPHPHAHAVVRQVKHFAHWVLPDVQRKR